jgi:hypothetical protein
MRTDEALNQLPMFRIINEFIRVTTALATSLILFGLPFPQIRQTFRPNASNYMLALPQEHAEFCRTGGLILNQADVAAVSRQVHLDLFYDAQLAIGAMGGVELGRRERTISNAF